MPEQSKFENVDLFASLEAIMKQNTGFYQSDLDIDKEIIAKAAASPNREDKTLLWFCRPSGTHCFRERDVFLKDTAPHNTWRFYMEQTSDRVLAYAIELTGKERGKIKGNLYELDYAKHYERVKEKELPADTVKGIRRNVPSAARSLRQPLTVSNTAPSAGKCPICNGKTRVQVFYNTVLRNFPLFCPKCKLTHIVDVEKLEIIIKNSEKQTF